jgi:hypothetical protein
MNDIFFHSLSLSLGIAFSPHSREKGKFILLIQIFLQMVFLYDCFSRISRQIPQNHCQLLQSSLKALTGIAKSSPKVSLWTTFCVRIE